MKRFEFRLDRVREWRKTQVDLEAARLERLFGEKHRLEEAAAELRRKVQAEEKKLATAMAAGEKVDGRQFSRLDDFRLHAKQEQYALANRREQLLARIDEQRRRLVEAQRNAKLLDRLKEKARDTWEKEYSKELEELAAELHLARRHSA